MFSSQRCGPTVVVKPPPPGVLPDTNAGSGTVADSYLSIVTGMAAVNGGGTVLLRGGQYVEPVHLKGVSGGSECPIVVRPYRCERPTIDASLLEFRFPSAAWIPVPGGHADEWVSVHPITPPPGHGSTLDRAPSSESGGTPAW